MHFYKYCCIFVVAACLGTGACTRDNPVLTNTPASQEGRQAPHAPVTGIALDAKDLAWIGMEVALITFDGNNTRTFYAGEGEEGLPSNIIHCLFEDRDSTVWIGTEKGLCTYIRYGRFKIYKDRNGNPVPVNSVEQTSDGVLVVQSGTTFYMLAEDESLQEIPSLHQPEGVSVRLASDDDGGLWIITGDATMHYNRNFEEISRHPAPVTSLADSSNLDAVRVRNKLWVIQGRTLSCFDLYTSACEFVYSLPESYPIGFMFYDGNFLLLKSHRYGLQAFNPDTRRMEEADLSYIPENPSLTDICLMTTDRLGNLWICYEHSGFTCISDRQRRLEQLNGGELRQRTRGSFVGSLKVDGKGNVWGNNDQQVFRYDIKGGSLVSGQTRELMGNDSHVSVVETDGDNLWLLGYRRIGVAPIPARGLPRMTATRLMPDRLGHSAAMDGRCFFTMDTPFLYSFDTDGSLDSLGIDESTARLYNRNARVLPIGKNELLIVCDGLACTLARPDQGRTEPIRVHNDGFSEEDRIVDAILDGQVVRLSLSRGGLYTVDLRSGEITEETALSGLDISCIYKYSDSRIILGSGSGIFYYDPESHALRNYLPYLDGVAISSFPSGSVVSGQNAIYLGSSDGCIVIPADIPLKGESHRPSIQWMTTRGKKGSQAIYLPVGEGSVTLSHRNNSFDIRFGCSSFDNQPVTIEYILDGHQQEWQVPGRQMAASYTQVPAGKYVFRIRELQPYTDTVLDEREMLITVRQSPWLTWPARLFYLLLAGAIAWSVISFFIKRREDRLRLEVAEEKSELEHRTNQMNMSFFANIAHEFRNPLTIISGPLESLLRDDALPQDAHKKLMAVSASANTMLRMIDQMLDFNQLEMDVLKLCVGNHDVSYEISRMADVFKEGAAPRGIRIDLRGVDEPFIVPVDIDKLEKILNNLFTNALKHTPDQGSIGLSLRDITGEDAAKEFGDPGLGAARYFQVDITNNGNRIPEEKLSDVFKRYYQARGTETEHSYGWGRGIGLYYVQQLVRVHHGSIRVYNLSDGVCFSFVLPVDQGVYADADHENDKVARILQINTSRPKNEAPREADPADDRQHLLIVDDDIQVAQYLRSLFEDHYRVTNRYSAEAALKDIEAVDPDLVISDVVMGKMSGYDFCRTLKSNMMFSHIPVILLTAKTDVSDSVAGLESGANAYVTKPFSAEYLTALVSSQLKNVENVRASLNQATEASLIDGDISEQDRNFIRELYELMDRHISEADLNVSSVCEELRISRSKFNYKLKGLTGTTPGAFFRHYKLNLAAKMLREGKYNVSEIADMTGFSSVSHFSASFKKMFGTAPKDYK